MQSARGELGEEGFALVLVLWGVLLLAVVGGSLLVEARTSRMIAATASQQLRARLIADGAINRGIMALLDVRDTLRVSLDGTAQSIRLFDTNILLRAESEAGKVNLNAAPLSLLIALFEGQGLSPAEASALAARVVTWRTAAAGTAQTEGIAFYQQAGRPYGPRFAPFRSVGELRLVIGMTDALQSAVAPLATVWSNDGSVDRSVAREDVLRILETAGDTLAASQRAARNTGQAAGANRPAAVGEAVTLTAALETADFVLSRVAVIQIAGNRQEPYRVLAWH
jgi:general secretion pathway protein K